MIIHEIMNHFFGVQKTGWKEVTGNFPMDSEEFPHEEFPQTAGGSFNSSDGGSPGSGPINSFFRPFQPFRPVISSRFTPEKKIDINPGKMMEGICFQMSMALQTLNSRRNLWVWGWTRWPLGRHAISAKGTQQLLGMEICWLILRRKLWPPWIRFFLAGFWIAEDKKLIVNWSIPTFYGTFFRENSVRKRKGLQNGWSSSLSLQRACWIFTCFIPISKI